ncbi:hypothetical protein BDZ89DRAFT_1147897 [Hymenopellis radicata]|nr:hypothetical protein BDZ89DRAFT_1147897 [Hymenopellis radicata]
MSSLPTYNLFFKQAQLENNIDFGSHQNFIANHTWSGNFIARTNDVSTISETNSIRPAELILVGLAGSGTYDVKAIGQPNIRMILPPPKLPWSLPGLMKAYARDTGFYMLVGDDDVKSFKCSSKIFALNDDEHTDSLIAEHVVPSEHRDTFDLIKDNYHLIPFDVRNPDGSPVLPINSVKVDIALKGSLVAVKFHVNHVRIAKPILKDIFTATVHRVNILVPGKALKHVYEEYAALSSAIRNQMRAVEFFVPGEHVMDDDDTRVNNTATSQPSGSTKTKLKENKQSTEPLAQDVEAAALALTSLKTSGYKVKAADSDTSAVTSADASVVTNNDTLEAVPNPEVKAPTSETADSDTSTLTSGNTSVITNRHPTESTLHPEAKVPTMDAADFDITTLNSADASLDTSDAAQTMPHPGTKALPTTKTADSGMSPLTSDDTSLITNCDPAEFAPHPEAKAVPTTDTADSDTSTLTSADASL